MSPVSKPSFSSPPRQEAASDLELVERILAGERRLFAALVQRHNQRLFRIVRAILRDESEAEDVVQQAHVTGYRQLAQFRGEGSYATWLTRIAVHEAYGRLRRRKRQALVALDDAGGDPAMAQTATPADDAYHRELGRLLERNIDELPDILRVVFVMREVEELGTAETASTLGLSETAVRVRLHRARQALQASLSRAMEAAPETFRFDGERCDRITQAVLVALALVDSL
jgi:RNA polymerase sigma-70 factor (ECF subfamily)